MRIVALRAVPALALLAGAAAGGGTGADPFPGPVQPDAGGRIAASRNGRAVAFEASVRDAGERWDPAEDPTVLLWDRRVGSLRQFTSSASDQPAVENGTFLIRVGTAAEKEHRARTLVAFRSSANLAGRNADGSPEIFVWDSRTGGFTQITDALAGESSAPALGAVFRAERDAGGLYTGNIDVRFRVAFLSTSDLTGANPEGLPQVFLWDSGLPEVSRLVQVSHGTAGAAGPPAIDGAGRTVAFVHDGDLLPGPDPSGAPVVHLWNFRRGLRRATEEGGVSSGAADPALDAPGRVVAWTAVSDPAGRRGVILARTRGRGRLRALFPAQGDHRAPALGKGRRRVVALSTTAEEGGGPVEERPVLLRKDGAVRDLGLPGADWGRPILQRDRPILYLVSDGDLDGTNASGRPVLWLVTLRP